MVIRLYSTCYNGVFAPHTQLYQYTYIKSLTKKEQIPLHLIVQIYMLMASREKYDIKIFKAIVLVNKVVVPQIHLVADSKNIQIKLWNNLVFNGCQQEIT